MAAFLVLTTTAAISVVPTMDIRRSFSDRYNQASLQHFSLEAPTDSPTMPDIGNRADPRIEDYQSTPPQRGKPKIQVDCGVEAHSILHPPAVIGNTISREGEKYASSFSLHFLLTV
jgi:hypothetical protein